MDSIVATEMLELGMEHCRRGQAAQAKAVFQAIREQLDPSRAQLEAISQLEATGCPVPRPSSDLRWIVQVGGGYDTNVNQGILSRYMVLGAGTREIELELGDAYKPVASPFGLVGLDASFRIGDLAVGQVSLQQRSNANLSALNLTTIAAGVIRPFILLDRPGRIQFDMGEARLGGNRYQQMETAGVQWVLNESKLPWLANIATLRNRYLTQPDQDSQLTEAGIWREQMVGQTFGVFGGASALFDNALRNRPGGDRTGYRFQLGLTSVWQEWLIQPRLNILRWRSSEVYSPGLLDVVRRHQLTQVGLQFTRPIAQDQQLVVEWRMNDARDSITLFSYRGQSLGIYWRAQR